jgi:hypothetical protein
LSDYVNFPCIEAHRWAFYTEKMLPGS